MKKFIFALMLMLCFGIIVRAEPLPLVPGTSQKTTEQKETKTTNEKTETKQLPSNKENEKKETTSEPANKNSNKTAITSVEDRVYTWFTVQHTQQSPVDKIAFEIEKASGNYKEKVIAAKNTVQANLNDVGEYSVHSYRATIDALFGYDYSYKGVK